MIAVIGGGSWATAIVKILLENEQCTVNWWVRTVDVRDGLASTGRNPRHLTTLQLDPSRLTVSNDLAEVVASSDTLLLAVPSVYISDLLLQLPADAYRNKRIISAVKGYIPDVELSVTQFLQQKLHIASDCLGVVSGPSHAEEVAEQRPTFLTVASSSRPLADEIAAILRCSYIHTAVSNEVDTIELCGLTKNVYAVAAGIAAGVGYGDNLIAVLTTAAAHELQGIIPESPLAFRLLSDLIVTCFSRHSRNRALGEAVARGMSPNEYFHTSGMVAEGYYSARIVHHLTTELPTPIAEAVYRVLYLGTEPKKEIDSLIDNIL